jgi:hypothetical protein
MTVTTAYLCIGCRWGAAWKSTKTRQRTQLVIVPDIADTGCDVIATRDMASD